MRFPFAFFTGKIYIPFWQFLCVLCRSAEYSARPWMIRAGLESQRVDKFYYGGVSRRRRRVLTSHFYTIAL